jgi:hypothetical protein
VHIVGSPLPESTRKGGRKKEFCNDACKNRRYRQYKQEKRDADMIEDPIWEKKYRELYVYCVKLEDKTKEVVQKLKERLRESERDNDGLRSSRDYYRDLYDSLRDDYEARMREQGFSKEQIEEFRNFWEKAQGAGPAYAERLYKSDDREKIQKLEKEVETLKQELGQGVDRLKQEYKQGVDALRNKATWQAKNISGLEMENSRLKDLLVEKSKREAELENILIGHGLYHALAGIKE